jgi:hypothetical protein
MALIRHLSFEDWLEHVFAPAVRMHGNPWFMDADAPWWDPTPGEALAYLILLGEQAPMVVQNYADEQIAQGLTYLFNTMARGDDGWFCSREVPTAIRRQAIAATFPLFSEIFQARCQPALGHLSQQGNALNGVAYMFWDVFPCVALPGDPDRIALNQEMLAVMSRILALSSPACIESALHGLGHAQPHFPNEVQPIIDTFLGNTKSLSPELRAYAAAARTGCVL